MDGRPGEGILPRVIKSYIDIIVRERTRELGISPSCCILLRSLSFNEGCSLQELSEFMYINKSMTTRNVKQLMDRGLVCDRNSIRNKYSLYLTPEGKKAAEQIKEIVDDVWKDIFADFTEKEVETFHRLSMKIADRMNAMVEEAGGKVDL